MILAIVYNDAKLHSIPVSVKVKLLSFQCLYPCPTIKNLPPDYPTVLF